MNSNELPSPKSTKPENEIAKSVRERFEQMINDMANMTDEERKEYLGDDIVGGGVH